ncbi:hypothetical protein F5887DRAFT_1160761 [Amanita rubescens]|nr:hypothetical protein F5887DRAFT_1160761 [Amanita rubescens]
MYPNAVSRATLRSVRHLSENGSQSLELVTNAALSWTKLPASPTNAPITLLQTEGLPSLSASHRSAPRTALHEPPHDAERVPCHSAPLAIVSAPYGPTHDAERVHGPVTFRSSQ